MLIILSKRPMVVKEGLVSYSVISLLISDFTGVLLKWIFTICMCTSVLSLVSERSEQDITRFSAQHNVPFSTHRTAVEWTNCVVFFSKLLMNNEIMPFFHP